ncbi:MAG: AsmA family protein, partial [Rhodospirillales bacterium]|nr:AsmA family protein [Rhodospirillales bacterium]
MRIFQRAFLWLFGIVFGLLSIVGLAIGVVALVYDWNDLRQPIAGLASRALDREVRIEGNLSVDPGWITRIEVEGLSIGNPDWVTEPQMLRLATLQASVDIGELLKGRIRLPSVDLTSPALLLVRNEEGANNWRFGPADTSKDEDERTQTSPLPIVERLTMTNGTVRFRGPGPSPDIDLELARVTAVQNPAEMTIQMEADGTYQGEPFEMRVDAGSLAALQSKKPYPIDLSVSAGATRASASGRIADPLRLQGLDLAIDFKGNNAADLFPLTGVVLPPTPAFHITGTLRRDGPAWSLKNFRGTMGDSDLGGDVAVDFSGRKPELTATVQSDRLVLADLAPAGGAPREDAEENSAGTSARPGRVLPDKEIDLGRLNAMNGEVTFRSDRI